MPKFHYFDLLWICCSTTNICYFIRQMTINSSRHLKLEQVSQVWLLANTDTRILFTYLLTYLLANREYLRLSVKMLGFEKTVNLISLRQMGWLKITDMKMTDQKWRHGTKLQENNRVLTEITITLQYNKSEVCKCLNPKHRNTLCIPYRRTVSYRRVYSSRQIKHTLL